MCSAVLILHERPKVSHQKYKIAKGHFIKLGEGGNDCNSIDGYAKQLP